MLVRYKRQRRSAFITRLAEKRRSPAPAANTRCSVVTGDVFPVWAGSTLFMVSIIVLLSSVTVMLRESHSPQMTSGTYQAQVGLAEGVSVLVECRYDVVDWKQGHMVAIHGSGSGIGGHYFSVAKTNPKMAQTTSRDVYASGYTTAGYEVVANNDYRVAFACSNTAYRRGILNK